MLAMLRGQRVSTRLVCACFLLSLAGACASSVPPLRIVRLRGGAPSADEYAKMKLSELQKELRSKGLSTKGLKGELVQRLVDHADGLPSSGAKRSAEEGLVEHESNKLPRAGDLSPPELRIVVEEEGENPLVRMYNSYHIKDEARKAGFRFDSMDRSWTLPVHKMLELMDHTDPSLITEEAIVERLKMGNFPELAAGEDGGQMQQQLKVDVKDGVVHVTGSTYDVKDKLRALGFRWDASNYAWTKPELEMEATLQITKGDESEESFATRVVEAIHAADLASLPAPATDQAGGEAMKKRAELSIEDGTVMVRYSYDIKDNLRTLGFRFNSQEKAWASPVSEVLMLSENFHQESDITLEALLSIPPETVPKIADSPPPEPSLAIVDDNVEISNSYPVKDELRKLGFSWAGEKVVWTKPLQDVMEQCGISDEKDLTMELLLGVAQAAQNTDFAESAKPATVQTPYAKLQDGEVNVYYSYAVKDKLRAMGFRWNVEGVCWTKSQLELSEMPGAEKLDFNNINMDDLLSLEAPAATTEKKEPYLQATEDEVIVFNSYDIKDQLRSRGFRWDTTRGAWYRSKAEVAASLNLEADAEPAEITIEKLLASDPVVADEGRAELEKLDPRLVLENDEVLVYDSYSIKDTLKALSFRFDSERKAWANSMVEVKRMLQLEDQMDITLEKVLAYAKEQGVDNPEEIEPQSGDPAKGVAADIPASCNLRSPSPAMIDQTPGELLSSMGRSLQGWSKSASAAG